jgi:hypothetical protein
LEDQTGDKIGFSRKFGRWFSCIGIL